MKNQKFSVCCASIAFLPPASLAGFVIGGPLLPLLGYLNRLCVHALLVFSEQYATMLRGDVSRVSGNNLFGGVTLGSVIVCKRQPVSKSS
jgi:hypothetical protein